MAPIAREMSCANHFAGGWGHAGKRKARQ